MKQLKLSLTIGWLYPELMSTYGDRGNIICFQKRCEWRGIVVEIKKLDIGYSIDELKLCDFLFMGGAQDKQQRIVSEDLRKKEIVLREMIENKTPGLYICGAYQFLGKYYKEENGTIIDGLNILDLYTENPGENHERLIGDILVDLNIDIHPASAASREVIRYSSRLGSNNNTLVGFENHGGRTYLGRNIKFLGKVISGYGNNGKDKTEGAIYKNSFGSYLHGPLLPKNPHFTDYLIKISLEKKYKKPIDLSPIDDKLEWRAHNAIAKRLEIEI